MPGSTILSPGSIDHAAMNTAIAEADAVPKKKSVIGRIKSKLSTKLGRRKSISVESPTPADLLKTEFEMTEDAINEQPNEEAVSVDSKSDVGSEQKQQSYQVSETEVDSYLADDQPNSVQQFNPPLSSVNSFVDDSILQTISDVRQSLEEYEQKGFETPEQTEDDDKIDESFVEEDEMGRLEVCSANNEEDTNCSVSHPEGGPEQVEINVKQAADDSLEDDDDTLEVFNAGEENQRHSSHREPEDDDEEDDDRSPLEASPPMQDVELVIIGVTPTSLRNRSADHDTMLSHGQSGFQEEEEPLDTEPDVISTPRICEPLSSPLKRVRPGPGVDMMSSILRESFSNASTLPHPPLQEIREEDDSTGSGGNDHICSMPRRFEARRHGRVASEAPIISSASISPQHEEQEKSLPTENHIHEEADEFTTGRQVYDEDEANFDMIDAGALITRAFGERIVTLLSADPWGDRQDGFDAIKLAVKKAEVSTIDPVTRQRLLCASLAAVQCGVEDRVAPVMFCALECFRSVLKEFARVLHDDRAFADTELTSAAVLNTQLSSLVGALVRKLGDSNKRTQRESTQALVRIARLRSLRALPHLLLHLSGREVPPRRQLETLRRLLQELGLANATESSYQQQQLTVETILQFVAPSLKIAEEKTRKAAVEILADLQMRTSNSTAWHAQLARAGSIKPEMLRVITRRVEELIAKREQQQAATSASEAIPGSAATNQAEEQVDDEAAFPPAELVDVPQEDAQSSIALLEAALSSAQNVVGPVCWRKLSSKTWSDRKEALLEVEKAMTEAKSDLRDTRPVFGGAAQGVFVAYSALLHRALGDSIAPVVNTALDTFATLVKIYGPRIEWREADVREVTLLALLRLLTVMQKPNTRTTRAACRGILKLARLPNARHPLRYVLSCVFGGEGSSACDPQVQMHLLRLLVPEFGFQADGLGASRVLDVVSKGLTHSSARVRRSAADVALSAQRLLGRDFVLARLQDVKPVTLKELEKNFVDGVGGSGAGERPQTVHATAAEASAPAAIGGSDLPPVTFGGLGEFSSRRLLSSAPVGIGRLQCTPLYKKTSASPSSQIRGSVLSNEEENLMDSILDNF